MSKNRTTIIGAGDLFMTRRIPEDGYEGFEELQALVKEHDARFVNLEMTFHDAEGFPAAESGGTWAMADPVMLDDVRRMGFNLFNTANNHSGDYSEGGVLATIRHLKERNMVFSGTGKNLAEANAACYLETKNARVALISCCSTFSAASRAGGQSELLHGRPGLNPVRFKTYYHVDPEHYAMAEELANVTLCNVGKINSIKMGYSLPFEEGKLPFGKEGMFVLDTENRVETVPDAEDLGRITAEIRETRRQADIVIVSYHSHEYRDGDHTLPALFTETFARACIDAGAQIFMGHGPHEMQGIEVYGDGVIFYSIGNFLFETETVSLQPYDAYINRKMPPDTKVGAYMDDRSKNGTAGYGTLENIWRAILPSIECEDGRVRRVTLHPVSLQQYERRSVKGIPVLSHDEKTLEYLAELSKPYGTTLRISGGAAELVLSKEM
ncbi:MAG: CapA family protein [Lachnospiraceae bacterium]|nr:CapA family protein [Lachnospiraceae bacterium]